MVISHFKKVQGDHWDLLNILLTNFTVIVTFSEDRRYNL